MNSQSLLCRPTAQQKTSQAISDVLEPLYRRYVSGLVNSSKVATSPCNKIPKRFEHFVLSCSASPRTLHSALLTSNHHGHRLRILYAGQLRPAALNWCSVTRRCFTGRETSTLRRPGDPIDGTGSELCAFSDWLSWAGFDSPVEDLPAVPRMAGEPTEPLVWFHSHVPSLALSNSNGWRGRWWFISEQSS